MKLLIVRHGIALDVHELPTELQSDIHRPLSAEGIEKMKTQALFFHRAIPKVEHIFCSTLLRAQQTAEIIAAKYKAQTAQELKHLTPESDPYDSIRELEKVSGNGEEPIIMVSHLPLVNRLLSLLTTGNEFSFFAFKKGGAAYLDVKDWTPGGAVLKWAVTPKLIKGCLDSSVTL